MIYDERNDLLELKASVEIYLSTLHDALIARAKKFSDILKRINEQLNEEE